MKTFFNKQTQKTDNMITVKPDGGLANRMRVINSALVLAKKLGSSITIFWEKNKDLNCSFSKLFVFPAKIKIVEYNKGSFFAWIRLLAQRILAAEVFDNKNIKILQCLKGDLRKLFRKPRIFIDTCHAFFPYEDFEAFVLAQEPRNKVGKYLMKFNDATIGVHIRSVKFHKFIEKNNASDFIPIMEEEIRRDERTNFFLATDSPDEEKTMQRFFGDRVIVSEKNRRRDNEKGIVDALVDLICLAHTKKILGSYWSSFSEVASQFHQIPLLLIGAKKTIER